MKTPGTRKVNFRDFSTPPVIAIHHPSWDFVEGFDWDLHLHIQRAVVESPAFKRDSQGTTLHYYISNQEKWRFGDDLSFQKVSMVYPR